MNAESQTCDRLRTSWPGFDASEPLPDWAAAHLRDCVACRSRLGFDPSRLFALLRGVSPEPVPEWTTLPEEAVAQRAGALRALRRRRAWALAGAAAVLLAGALWLLRPGPVAPGVSELGPVAAHEIRGEARARSMGAVHAAAPPTLEAIASPAARVMEFKIFGDEGRVTEVILIFDEGIEL